MNKLIMAAVAAAALGCASAVAMADDIGAVMTLTGQTAATVTAPAQNNARINARSVSCVFNQSAHTNTPSTTFAIQGYDAANAVWVDLIRSAAITADATPTLIAAGIGVDTVTNLAAALPIMGQWRVSATIGGTTPIVTAKIGCNRTF